MKMYIEKNTTCYIDRKNIFVAYLTQKGVGGIRYHRKIRSFDIYDAAERQFLLQIPRARVHRDGKNCRVSMEEAQILFRHRLWQSRDAECSLFSNYIALGTGMYDAVAPTDR